MPSKRQAKAKQAKPRATDFSAELLNVKDKDIAPGRILLDPNNPRFMEEDALRVPDKEIQQRQDRTMQLFREEIGIEDVKDKIASLGYQRHERVFVRPLKGDPKRYVVLEG